MEWDVAVLAAEAWQADMDALQLEI